MSSFRARNKTIKASYHLQHPSPKISKRKETSRSLGTFLTRSFSGLFSFPAGDAGTSVNTTAQDRRQQGDGSSVQVIPVSSKEMAAEGREEQIARVIEDLGITSASPDVGKVIDRWAEIRQTQDDIARFKEQNPSFNPNIRPEDAAWITKRGFFVKELEVPTKTLIDIFIENFPNYENVEKLYLEPTEDDQGLIFPIQELHTKNYKQSLSSTGKFRGVPDNLATKLTMLHFGLPIEPLTMANVTMSAEVDEYGVGDKTCPPDPPEELPYAQRILYVQKPLEFLDGYEDSRSYGYPMLRRPKQNDLTSSVTFHDPVTDGPPIESQTMNRSKLPTSPEQHFINMRGGSLTVTQVETENYIHGFNGKFVCSNDSESFKRTALQLLGYDFEAGGPWEFFVDIYQPGTSLPDSYLIQSSERKYAEIFQKVISPFLSGDLWRVFVRSVGEKKDHSGGMLEPCRKGMKDIIRLIDDDVSLKEKPNIVYWKIPKDLKPDYGINQCQPGFFSAMKLLYCEEPPQGVVIVRFEGNQATVMNEFNLGWGGMEATVNLWNFIRGVLPTLNPDEADSLQLQVGYSVQEPSGDLDIGAHLSGDESILQASVTNAEFTFKAIKGALDRATVRPSAFKIWHNAQERESGADGEVMEFRKKQAISALRKFFKGWETREGRTNCCWFRPEWKTFEVERTPSGPKGHWPGSPACQKLATLRAVLQKLEPGESFDSFSLVEAQGTQDGRRYVITKDTTEEEWRMFVYDWLHRNKIFYEKITNLNYVLNPSQWGLSPTIAGIGVTHQQTYQDLAHQPKPNESMHPPTGNTQVPLASQQPTRLNKARIIKFPAAKHKPQKWAEWSTEQHFLDRLQRKSWIKDQSVIEPGRLPAPPLYGPARELQLRVGSSMPTIFSQRLTPTDIKQLQDENQKLRNQVLERIFACPICNEEFETYDKEAIRIHLRLHQQHLEEAGQCPSCGDPQWAFMTNGEKRAHFATHQHQHESARIKNFYDGQRCPVCDRDLSILTPELVIKHCLEHVPGQVQFCDRCGLHETECTAEELNHHHTTCRLAGQRNHGEPDPMFCKSCGLNVTGFTPEKRDEHRESHLPESAGLFCAKCGLNETAHHWSSSAIAAHDSHCMPPSGPAKKFCEKCGILLALLDVTGTVNHQTTCRLVEPHQQSDRDRLLEIKKRQDTLRETEARLNTLNSIIANKRQDQEYREERLRKSESELQLRVSAFTTMDTVLAEKGKLDDSDMVPCDDDEADQVCPLALCSVVLSRMSKAEAIAHIKTHAHQDLAPDFKCPLAEANGHRCDQYLSLKDDGFDLTNHYHHKFLPEQPIIIRDEITQTADGMLQLAQDQVASDKNFIDVRTNLQDPSSPPTHPPHAGAQSVTPPRPLTQSTSSRPPVPEMLSQQPPASAYDLTLLTKVPSTLNPDISDAAATTRSMAAAQKKLAEARKRRAAVMDPLFRPVHDDEDSDEDPEGADVSVTKIEAKALLPKKKVSSRQMTPAKEAVAPAKIPKMAGKKRKQDKEVLTITKDSLRGAPAKKKQKQKSGSVATTEPKSSVGRSEKHTS